jgi:hypothetical protein
VDFKITYSAKPIVTLPIADFVVRTGTTWRFRIPSGVFTHPNDLEMTTWLETLPKWVKFDNATDTLTGKATDDEVGLHTLYLVANDTLGALTTEPFEVEVVKNFLPVVNNQQDVIQVDENVLWDFTLPPDTFLDPNGDPMNYTIATGTFLPPWLSFEPAKRRFQGIPTGYSRQNVSVTATDIWGAKTTMTFTLITGKRPNTPPRIKTPLKD